MQTTTTVQIHDLVAEVAERLGGNWFALPCDENSPDERDRRCWHGRHIAVLEEFEPERNYLRLKAEGSRVYVWAALGGLRQYLRRTEQEELRLQISAAASRGARVIAREIERRLLPDTRKAFALARPRLKAAKEQEVLHQQWLDELVEATGGQPARYSRDRVNFGAYREAVDGHAAVYLDGTIKFEVTAPWPVAIQIARLLGQLHAQGVPA